MSRSYTQITLADRRRLHHMVAAKVPVNEMARQLGRHRSTIYREIRRNTFRDRELPDYDGYYSTVANDTAKDRRRRLRKLRRHSTLRTEIINPVGGSLVAGTDCRTPVVGRPQSYSRLQGDNLSLHLQQGRLWAWSLSVSTRGTPKTSSNALQEAARRCVSSHAPHIPTA